MNDVARGPADEAMQPHAFAFRRATYEEIEVGERKYQQKHAHA